jgi:DNA (cytosine-5)-methyltransferase 1
MLPSAVTHLFPTPSVADGLGGHLTRSGARSDELLLPGVAKDLASDSPAQDWREYEAAIRRQEAAFGRPAPLPTEPGAKGQPRLSPAFVEWLMGLPDGHVTNPAIGISRNDQLKALGNGVVPQQCAAALRAFLHDTAERVAV